MRSRESKKKKKTKVFLRDIYLRYGSSGKLTALHETYNNYK